MDGLADGVCPNAGIVLVVVVAVPVPQCWCRPIDEALWLCPRTKNSHVCQQHQLSAVGGRWGSLVEHRSDALGAAHIVVVVWLVVVSSLSVSMRANNECMLHALCMLCTHGLPLGICYCVVALI